MPIRIQGAREHNLQGVTAEFGDGLTVVTGVSGSGKTSLVFDTLYYEARRRFLDVYSIGSPAARQTPANVEAITGLGPAVAVGQNLLNRNPNSTLATASGLHPFLRLLYAHFGVRACPTCAEPVKRMSEDEIVERLASLASLQTIRLFVPLVQRGVGSHRTLLRYLVESFGTRTVWVDGSAWNDHHLAADQPHSIEILLAELTAATPWQEIRPWIKKAMALAAQAITVRWREQHETLAFAPVCLVCGEWLGDLRPADFNAACPHCEGQGCARCQATGLPPQAAAVRWEGLGFLEFQTMTVDQALARFQCAMAPIPARLRLEIERRLMALQRVGLGYIALDRSAPTLSRGEAQRVRLALTMISRLEDMLHVLDEPTVGQHPADVARLLPAFRELPGPVVFVEHDRMAAAGADEAIDLGPGAGRQGGRVIFTGTPSDLWQADTATGQFFSRRACISWIDKRPLPKVYIIIRGASLRNLRVIDVPVPVGRLTVVTGVSGSGKSTLVEDVLMASLTQGEPIGCQAIEGPWLKPVMVDQSPIGRNPRSNPATYTKLADLIRDMYAQETGLSPSHFSFNRPEGACPTCHGLGAIEVPMRYLPSTWVTCTDCEGRRFTDEVLMAGINLKDRKLSIAEFLEISVSEALELINGDNRLLSVSQRIVDQRKAALRILTALQDIGLGYLSLGQPSPTLSGGEAQRVKLARYLGQKSLAKELLILDEPSTGLHPQDLTGLLAVLDRLARAGATILVVEHNMDVIRAADWVVDLGPGAGPQGGRLLYAGPTEKLSEATESLTGQALRSEDQFAPIPVATSVPIEAGGKGTISIRGARVHNLQDVAVDIPKARLTVITGVSGSGKSSLVGDVLEVEARRRFLETLSMYERQGTHEGLEADVDSISGLGVVLTVGSERLVYSQRATVGSATHIIYHLAALFATLGERACPQCGTVMARKINQWHCLACGALAPLPRPRHFLSSTYAAACIRCNGVGTLQTPQPRKLILHPEKPLIAGAMHSPGFFPNGYLGKPFNHGYYLVLALGERYGFDPAQTPWQAMSPEAQQAFLFGDPQQMMVTVHSRTGRTYTRSASFPGFYGFIRDWDVGGTYTDTVPCPVCGGARLRAEYLAVRLAGFNIYELSQMTFSKAAQRLEALAPGIDQLVQNSSGEKATGEIAQVVSNYRTVQQRMRFLIQVGLGYLHLDRLAGTLSAGEAQRIRLASLLGSNLTALTLLLDEPTRGLHPTEVEALLRALLTLCEQGNTVIVVEHDRMVMQAADHLIDMGPGAGQFGGRVVAQGKPDTVAHSDTITGQWLRGTRRFEIQTRQAPLRWMTLHGARANNLRGEVVRFPLGVLVGVCGVSGSGKSTLVVDTLGRALAPKKQTTSVAYEPVDPGEYDSIDGAPARVLMIDQSRAGLGSPASYLGLTQRLQTLFADSENAQALGMNRDQFATRCSVCGGSGVNSLDMNFLPTLHQTCEACRGSGYLPEVWQVRWRGFSLPEVFGMTIDQIIDLYGDDESLTRSLQVAREVGLGYLVLRQPGYALSGGEAQRLKIAQELYRKISADTLYLFDEPSVGQHLEDVQRLNGVLQRLVRAGGSVIVVEHHPHLLTACDWLIELGPGGGPDGGHVIAEGTPERIAAGETPIAPFLHEVVQ